jgi:hypothetical protein
MADQTLEVEVKLSVTGEAEARSAQASLSEIVEDTASASSNLGAVNRELGESHKKAGEAARDHTDALKGMRTAFGLLNNIVPDFGNILQEAFEGPMGVVIALSMAVAKITESLKKYNEELDKIPENEMVEHQKNIDALKDSWNQAKIALGDYHSSMSTAGKDKDQTAIDIANNKALTDAELENQKKLIEGYGRMEIARLKSSGASPAQIAAAEESTQQQLDEVTRKKDHADNLGALEAEQKEREKNKEPLNRAAVEALRRKKEADDAFTKNQNDLKKDADAINPTTNEGKALLKKQQDAESDVENAKNLPDTSFSSEGVPIDMRATNAIQLKEAQDRLTVANSETDRAKKAYANDAGQTESLEEKKKTADVESDRASKKSEDNQARLVELPPEIEVQRKLEATKNAATPELEAIKRKENFFKNGVDVDATVAAGVEGVQHLEEFRKNGLTIPSVNKAAETVKEKQNSGQPLTFQDQQALSNQEIVRTSLKQVGALKELEDAMGHNGNATILSIAQMIELHKSNFQIQNAQAQEIAILKTQMKALQSQTVNAANRGMHQ